MCWPAPGRRIAIWGPSGSGKTTLARALGERLGLDVIELDALFHHRPDWQDATPAELRAKVSAALRSRAAGWVCDGNDSAVADLVLAEAESVVWLRLPFRIVYPRLARRTLSRAARRTELWGGNRESWRQTLLSRDSMLLWGITAWRRHHRTIARRLAELPAGVDVAVLRSPQDVRRYLGGVARSSAGDVRGS